MGAAHPRASHAKHGMSLARPSWAISTHPHGGLGHTMPYDAPLGLGHQTEAVLPGLT